MVAGAHVEKHAVQHINHEIEYDSKDDGGSHDPIEALGRLNEHDDEPNNGENKENECEKGENIKEQAITHWERAEEEFEWQVIDVDGGGRGSHGLRGFDYRGSLLLLFVVHYFFVPLSLRVFCSTIHRHVLELSLGNDAEILIRRWHSSMERGRKNGGIWTICRIHRIFMVH